MGNNWSSVPAEVKLDLNVCSSVATSAHWSPEHYYNTLFRRWHTQAGSVYTFCSHSKEKSQEEIFFFFSSIQKERNL